MVTPETDVVLLLLADPPNTNGRGASAAAAVALLVVARLVLLFATSPLEPNVGTGRSDGVFPKLLAAVDEEEEDENANGAGAVVPDVLLPVVLVFVPNLNGVNVGFTVVSFGCELGALLLLAFVLVGPAENENVGALVPLVDGAAVSGPVVVLVAVLLLPLTFPKLNVGAAVVDTAAEFVVEVVLDVACVTVVLALLTERGAVPKRNAGGADANVVGTPNEDEFVDDLVSFVFCTTGVPKVNPPVVVALIPDDVGAAWNNGVLEVAVTPKRMPGPAVVAVVDAAGIVQPPPTLPVLDAPAAVVVGIFVAVAGGGGGGGVAENTNDVVAVVVVAGAAENTNGDAVVVVAAVVVVGFGDDPVDVTAALLVLPLFDVPVALVPSREVSHEAHWVSALSL